MQSRPGQILKDVFGYHEFKPLQEEVIRGILAKKDTLVIMPTGGGKSLCYQLPALIFDGLTVVVSPLISLMKDQVEQLAALGVPALFLNSSLSPGEYRENMNRIHRGEVKLLYAAPEALLSPRLQALLASVRLDCFTIDEAHCISEWGHDFRPEYRQLAEIRSRFPSAVCVALTATATPRVRTDIKSSLGFRDSDEYMASFDRDSLLLEVAPKKQAASQVLSFIRKFPGQSGIIYCFSRQQVDDLASLLASKGLSVRPYHAGLTDEERKRNQELFIRDEVQIIVATIAFGMGINKPNVRFVVHHDLPKNLESYYQEIGRAGRDGLPAHCLLLFSYADVKKIHYFIDQKEQSERKVAKAHLQALLAFAQATGCRRRPLLAHFGEKYQGANCGMCDNCLGSGAQKEDVTVAAQKFLSCAKRTGEMFGAGHLADVLLGSQSQKVIQHGHHSLTTYGIGREYSKDQWFNLSRQLVEQGYLFQDPRYGSLKLTEKAYQMFKSGEKIWAVVSDPTRTGLPKENVPEYDAVLFQQLKGKRKELADAAGVPPYVIFSDKSLVEMAASLPVSTASFLSINGVGQVKLDRYGETFMSLIRAYVNEHDLSDRADQSISRPRRRSEEKLKHVVVAEAFNAGQAVKALAAEFGVQENTILNHLARYAQEGRPLRREGLLDLLPDIPPEQHRQVFEVFDRLGTEFLKPAYDALDGSIGYDELKLLRLDYLSDGHTPAG